MTFVVLPFVSCLLGALSYTYAFQVPFRRDSVVKSFGKAPPLFAETSSESQGVLDEFSEERKAELFQFLLRDLQVEGGTSLL